VSQFGYSHASVTFAESARAREEGRDQGYRDGYKHGYEQALTDLGTSEDW